MLPQFDGDSRFTRAEIVGFTLILVITTMLLPVAGRGGPVYLTAMAVTGFFLLYHVANLARFTSKFLAGRVVHASVIYLPLILGIMVAWKRLMG